jgi:hypothetical protein
MRNYVKKLLKLQYMPLKPVLVNRDLLIRRRTNFSSFSLTTVGCFRRKVKKPAKRLYYPIFTIVVHKDIIMKNEVASNRSMFGTGRSETNEICGAISGN